MPSVVTDSRGQSTVDPLVVRSDGYRIRRARESDRPSILELYRSILNPIYSDDWFDWKYVDIPYATELPIVVATTGDEVVGAGGFVPLEMHTGCDTVMAVQPCDAAVHPNHRRQGLYTDILGAALDDYTAKGVAFAFDFPNRLSRGTFEKHGWRPVGNRESFVRIQRPSGMLGHGVARLLDPLCPHVASAVTRTIGSTPGKADVHAVEITCVDGVPASTFAALYLEHIPDGFHAYRDERFYDWRFANPLVNYRSYIAAQDGQPTAAVIAGRATTGRGATTYLSDVLPLAGVQAPTGSFAALADAVIRDHADADVVIAPPSNIPQAVLNRYGFLSNRRLPLSLVSQQTVHGVKPLARPTGVVNGQSLHDASAWTMTFAEFDTH